MYVQIHGTKVAVLVSDAGVFHDKEMKFHANTLKGLATKMRKGPINSTLPPLRVENTSTSRKGTVIGLGKAQYGRSYKVRWDDGNSSVVVDSYHLRKPMTEEERQKLDELMQASETAEEAYNKADDALSDYEGQFSVEDELRGRFGIK